MRGNAILCVGMLHKSEVALTCTPDWHTRTYFLHFIGYYVVARRQIDFIPVYLAGATLMLRH